MDDEACPFAEGDVHLRKGGANSSWGQLVLVNVRMCKDRPRAVSAELIQASVFFYGARTAMQEIVRTCATPSIG